MSARSRQADIMREVLLEGEFLPGGQLSRHDCKVLVKRKLLKPRPPLGYQPTARAKLPGAIVTDASGLTALDVLCRAGRAAVESQAWLSFDAPAQTPDP